MFEKRATSSKQSGKLQGISVFKVRKSIKLKLFSVYDGQ